ncbi:DUF2330 domain-containing protein [Candidatus Woesearchaeota archaeon]|nr:DUF2330 domain-containing protein [Candidatus Woesearchaeota archaeon]
MGYVDYFFAKLYTIFYHRKSGINPHITLSFSRKFFLVIVSFFIFISVAYAMCPAFVSPPQRFIAPDDNTHALLVFDFITNIERLILEPAFHGNAKEFGMVMPIPSKPELLEADEKLFNELEDLTNPFQRRGGFVTTQSASAKDVSEGVTIIEVKDVGDFTATTLTAENTQSLLNWLKEHNYVPNPSDEENYDYYVKRGGYFFVALKVNMEKAKVDKDGNLHGKLRPIEFKFQSSEPMLPIRIMRSDMEDMSFTLYTLSDAPYYIPGSKVLFSRSLSKNDLEKAPTLKKYGETGDWLVRSHLKFQFSKIRTDLFLERGDGSLLVNNPNQFKIVNPTLLSENTGILKEEGPELYLGNEKMKNDLKILSNIIEKVRNDSQSSLAANEKIKSDLKTLSKDVELIEDNFEKGLINVEDKYENRVFLLSIVIGVLIGIVIGVLINSRFKIFKKQK